MLAETLIVQNSTSQPLQNAKQLPERGLPEGNKINGFEGKKAMAQVGQNNPQKNDKRGYRMTLQIQEKTDRPKKRDQISDNTDNSQQKQGETQLSSTKSGRPRYRSRANSIGIGVIISLSGLNFGYALSACSVINLKQVMGIYGITMAQPGVHSLVIGLVPAGGIIGALLNQLLVKYFNRKYSIVIMCLILWLGLALMLIQYPQTLYVGRFIQGIAIGFYLCLSPIHLKEVTPKELRPTVMTIYGLGKAFGIVVAYSLQNIFIAANYTSNSYIVLMTFNGYIAVIQVVLYFIFVPHSPLELVAKNKIEQARQELLKIYNQQYLEEVLNEYTSDHASEKKDKSKQAEEVESVKSAQQVQEINQYKRKAKIAYLIGGHVVLVRQFMGANCVTTFAGQIIQPFAPSISTYMGLILNLLQFLFNLISVLFLTKRFGRRPILLVGVGAMTLSCFAIVASLVELSQFPILIFMSIYMALNGGTIYTVGFSYPSEVLAPKLAFLPNILGLIGLTIVTSVPPLVVGAMPGNNAYPLFIFFGCYGIFAFVILILYMKESKGLTYKQIIESF